MATDVTGAWYYTQNHRKHGPVSFHELQTLVQNGTLGPTDNVWQEGMTEWVEVRHCSELFENPGNLGLPTTDRVSPKPLPAGRPEGRRRGSLLEALGDGDEEDETSRPSRRRRGRADDDSEEPGLRRRRRKKSSRSNVAILAAAAGLFVLFLIIGLVIANVSGKGKNVTLQGSRTWKLRVGEAKTYRIRLHKDHVVNLTVTSKGESDVDLFVFDGKDLIAADEDWGQHCAIRFIPEHTKRYKVVVVNRVWIGDKMNVDRNAPNSGTLNYIQTPPEVTLANLAEEAKAAKAKEEKAKKQPEQKAPPKKDKAKAAGKKKQSTTQSIPPLVVGQAVNGSLGRAKHKTYPVRLAAGVAYTIDMKSDQFASRAILYDANSRLIQVDDKRGERGSARIQFVPSKTGLYQIVADAKDDLAGKFQLQVSETPTLRLNQSTSGYLTKAEEQTFVVSLQSGRTYTFDLVSSKFDAYLALRNTSLRQLAEDDDGGEGRNARIIFRPVSSGPYLLTARALHPQAGKFEIIASEAANTKTAVTKDIEERLRFFGTQASTTGTISPRTKATYTTKLYKSRKYTVDVKALTPKFDPRVVVRTPTNRYVGFDDNGGGKRDARLMFQARETGDYTIEVRGRGPTPTGRFEVTINGQ